MSLGGPGRGARFEWYRLMLAAVQALATGPGTAVQSDPDLLNANANIQVGDIDVSAANPVPIEDTWEVVLISDLVLNNSAKVIPVPLGWEYQVLWIYIEYTSNPGVGNRQLQINVRDVTNDVIGQFRPGVVQAASLTRHYMFASSLADLLGFRDTDYLMTPIPPTLFLSPGQDLRIFDNNAIAVAFDDMLVWMQVARRPV